MQQADLLHSFRKSYPVSGTDISLWLASSEVLSSVTSSKTTYIGDVTGREDIRDYIK
jgi:hypothetical protein